jgi:hypothetical protein
VLAQQDKMVSRGDVVASGVIRAQTATGMSQRIIGRGAEPLPARPERAFGDDDVADEGRFVRNPEG